VESSSISWRVPIRLQDFAFVRAVGEAFLGVFPKIVARRKDAASIACPAIQLLVKRGRYVEFNLVYDRGTQFGFGTDADPEALPHELAALGQVVNGESTDLSSFRTCQTILLPALHKVRASAPGSAPLRFTSRRAFFAWRRCLWR